MAHICTVCADTFWAEDSRDVHEMQIPHQTALADLLSCYDKEAEIVSSKMTTQDKIAADTLASILEQIDTEASRELHELATERERVEDTISKNRTSIAELEKDISAGYDTVIRILDRETEVHNRAINRKKAETQSSEEQREVARIIREQEESQRLTLFISDAVRQVFYSYIP